jgi:hypothetical protein
MEEIELNYQETVINDSNYNLIVKVGHDHYGEITVNEYGSSIEISEDNKPPEDCGEWTFKIGKGLNIKTKRLALNVLERYTKNWPSGADGYNVLEVYTELVEQKPDEPEETQEILPINGDKKVTVQGIDATRMFKLFIDFS